MKVSKEEFVRRLNSLKRFNKINTKSTADLMGIDPKTISRLKHGRLEVKMIHIRGLHSIQCEMKEKQNKGNE